MPPNCHRALRPSAALQGKGSQERVLRGCDSRCTPPILLTKRQFTHELIRLIQHIPRSIGPTEVAAKIEAQRGLMGAPPPAQGAHP